MVVPMASWLLLPLPSFPWLPPPPPPGSSSGGRGGGGGGGDGGDWRPNVVAAFASAQVGSALRRRFAGLLCSPVLLPAFALTSIPFLFVVTASQRGNMNRVRSDSLCFARCCLELLKSFIDWLRE